MSKRRSSTASRRGRKRSPQQKRSRKANTSVNAAQAVRSFITGVGETLFGLVRGRRGELSGVLLVLLSLYTFFALLVPAQGSLGNAWLGLLRVIFGWGMFLAPVAAGALGVWILLRNFDLETARLEAEQLVGSAMLLLAVLALFHALLGLTRTDLAFQAAAQGLGGGYLGAAFLMLFVTTLGIGGALVALVAWVLLGLTFTIGLSVPELLARGYKAVERALGSLRWSRRGSARGQPSRGASRTSEAGEDAPGVHAGATSLDAANRRSEVPSPPIREHGTAAQVAWRSPIVAEILEVGQAGKADQAFDRERARLIEDTLKSFGAPARVVEINRGPTITQFGVEPDFVEGRGGRRVKVKVSKISSLADDLALALAAASIRIEAPVPGKGYVGIEVPNTEVALVALRDVMESPAFERINSRLRIGLGRDVSGQPVAADLAAMPHLLIAGTTGSGKSVCVNLIISCLLLHNTPDQLRFLMVDPKRVELTFYNGVPHLLAPVVVDLDRVVPAMQWVSKEMDQRYRRFSGQGVRNIREFNEKMRQSGGKPLPYLVLIIDELADLMMLAPDETERVLTRLAQLARATGIHLVIATQRPSVDVVTGLIKANFPARIAFAVASSIDSRVILDQPGAERLLGRGDMLFQAPDAAMPRRLQGAFVSEPELGRLIRFWKTQAVSAEARSREAEAPAMPGDVPLKQAPLWEDVDQSDEEVDELYDDAVTLVRQMRRASISLLQRRLRIGYTRAARLVDQLEERGIVGPEPGGSQAREVLDYGPLATEGSS